jgi:hypothetical protein
MATTIMISTSVKPALRDVLVFITIFPFFCGVNCATGGLSMISVLFTYCLLQPHLIKLATSMP